MCLKISFEVMNMSVTND